MDAGAAARAAAARAAAEAAARSAEKRRRQEREVHRCPDCGGFHSEDGEAYYMDEDDVDGDDSDSEG